MDGTGSDYTNSYFTPLLTGGGEWKPKTIIGAISEIQQFYVMESKGQEIPAEFLTLQGTLGFLRTGMGSAMLEGIFLILFFPVFQFYLTPFVFHSPDRTTTLLLDLVPFAFLISNTIMCFYVSRYYVGTLTRRAINSIFLGRAMILMLKSFLMYFLYFCAAKLATPERVWSLARHLAPQAADSFYYGVFKVLPHIIPDAAICSVAILLSAVLPYGSAYLLDRRRRQKVKKNETRITGRRRQKNG